MLQRCLAITALLAVASGGLVSPAVAVQSSRSSDGQASFDVRGFALFWELADRIARGEEPAPGDWDRLLGHPGYVVIEQKGARAAPLKECMEVVFGGDAQQLERTLETGDSRTRRICAHLEQARERRADLEDFVRELRAGSQLQQAIAAAAQYLPPGASEGPAPTTHVLLFEPNGFGGTELALDALLLADMSAEQRAEYLAHEFHHVFRGRAMADAPAREEDAAALVGALSGLSEEGIASLLDKRQWLAPAYADSLAPLWQEVTASFRELYAGSAGVLAGIDSVLAEVEEGSMSLAEAADRLRGTLPWGGHPTGMYMALAIEESAGREAVAALSVRPAEFLLAYQGAVTQDPHRFRFSPEAVAVLRSLAAPPRSAPRLPAPRPRDHHAMVAGPAGTSVIFGGSVGRYPDHALLDDTWAWDGSGWTRFEVEGPPPHSSVSAAYDSANSKVVLFGGWTDDGDLAETWTWDGAAWTQHEVSGPTPRSSAAMSWDPWSRRVILFGGCGDGDPADTWAWDGTRWERLDSRGPGNRCRATMAPLGRLGGLVLFGGVEGRGPAATRHGDAWLFREGAWTQIVSTGDGPDGRANHMMVRDPERDVLVVFGGTPSDRVVRGDTWTFDGRGWDRASTPGPPPREVAAWAWHAASGAVLHGGRSPAGESLGDTWLWTGDAWREAPGSAEAAADPGERAAHGLVYHDGLAQTLMLGGVRAGGDAALWAWDGSTWRRVGSVDRGPGARGHFALAYDPAADRILVHGGFRLESGGDPDARFGDLWAWEDSRWTRVHDAEVGPGVRDHHAMVWDRGRGELVLFGGGRGVPSDQTLLGDTWIYDGHVWRNAHSPGPPARATHRLAYDERRESVVLFGGWGEEGLLADTWEWDGARWERVATEGPPARFAARLAYDAALERVVLYGGRGAEGDLDDSWEWDGGTWSRMDGTGPGPRNVHAMAYDSGRSRLVMYGGITDGARRGDTWERDGRLWLRVDAAAAPAPD